MALGEDARCLGRIFGVSGLGELGWMVGVIGAGE